MLRKPRDPRYTGRLGHGNLRELEHNDAVGRYTMVRWRA